MSEVLGGRLVGKVAVVTGAGQGIGRAIAQRYAAEGASVVVNDLDRATAEAVAADLVSQGLQATPVQADVSVAVEVDSLFQRAMGEYGRLDILVNNAGIVSPMLHILEADEAWWRRIIDVNLTGAFLTCKRAAHIMVEAGMGSIINMSSGGATRAHRAFTSYDASKGGIEAFTRALALDLGPYGIRVNALMPGSIDTADLGEAERAYRGQNVPLGRVGEPNDMTGPAVFLASDDSSYVTGEVVRVDGGMLAQQRSATVDIMPPSGFPKIGKLK